MPHPFLRARLLILASLHHQVPILRVLFAKGGRQCDGTMGFCAPTPLAKGVAQLRFSNSCFSTALIPPTVTNNLYSQCRTARNWNRARKRSRNGIGSRSERRFPSPAASPNSLFQNILRASRLYARICEQNLSARVRNLHKTDILSRSIPKKNNGYPITVQLTAHPSGGWPSGRGKLAESWPRIGTVSA